MEQEGISVDRQILSRISGELAQKAAALEGRGLRARRRERFTIGSPKQLGDILFGRMGLPGGSKTKTGAMVDHGARTRGAGRRRDPTNCRARSSTGAQLTKLKSTYTDALPGYIPP